MKEITDNLQVGDVICTLNTTSRFSGAIANITNSEWSHVFMYIGNGNIVESSKGGVLIAPLKKYLKGKHNVAVLRLKATDFEREVLAKRVLSHVGKRYGRVQLMYYLLLRILGLSENPKFQLDLQPNAMVCSEAIAFAMLELGYEVKKGFKPAGVEPADFAESDQFTEIAYVHVEEHD